jgi:hypothetical protein
MNVNLAAVDVGHKDHVAYKDHKEKMVFKDHADLKVQWDHKV